MLPCACVALDDASVRAAWAQIDHIAWYRSIGWCIDRSTWRCAAARAQLVHKIYKKNTKMYGIYNIIRLLNQWKSTYELYIYIYIWIIYIYIYICGILIYHLYIYIYRERDITNHIWKSMACKHKSRQYKIWKSPTMFLTVERNAAFHYSLEFRSTDLFAAPNV